MNKCLVYLISILLLGAKIAHTQSSHDYLKTPASPSADSPAWAQEMYKPAPNVLKVDALYKSYYEAQPFEKNIHTQNYKHWRPLVESYLQEDGSLLLPTLADRAKVFRQVTKNKATATRSGNGWKAMGPFDTYTTGTGQVEVSWQANSYTIDQSLSHPTIVYVGTEAGGIFKSEDKGMNWYMVSQSTLIRTVRTIKVHPTDPDIVYAGTGNAVYKTIDGGNSWTEVFSLGGLNANDLSIHPSTPDLIHLASNQGLYISTNGGVDWLEVLRDRVWDIERKPDDATVMYILKSNAQEVRSEVWKSTDSGFNFSERLEGWYAPTGSDRIDGGGRMTVTPADPDRIYVILVGQSKAGDNGYIGIYRSSDAGESWDLTDPPVGGPYTDDHPNLATLSNTNTLQQGYYNLGIASSHSNADELIIGCLNLWRSFDGGETYEVMGGYRGSLAWIHPDQQELEINGDDMWAVSDGGINYSTDLFETHESRKKGLNASDWWGFGSAWNEDLIVGGRYHNGNSAHRPAFGDGNFLRLGGGEAPTGYVQPGGQSVSYFSDISAKIIPQSLDGAVEDVASLSMFPLETYFASNYSELEFAPNCYSHMWLGRENRLYKSIDNGNTFEEVHAFGAADDPILHFEISRVDPQVMYLYQRTTFFGAVLWVTLDGGVSWTQKNFPSAGSQRSGALMIHAQEPGTLWVSFAHQTNDGQKIFKTTDYGDSWENLSENILNGHQVTGLFHQAGTENLFLSTNFSIFMHDGTEWMACDQNLPNRFFANRMAPFYKDNKLRVASYGNGVWEMELPESGAPIAQPTVDKLSSDCSRDTFYFDDYSVVEHDSDIAWEWSFSPEPDYVSDSSARNPKVVFGEIGSYAVSLTVTNSKGTDTYIEDDMIAVQASSCNPDIYPGEAIFVRQSGDDFVQLPDMQLATTEFTLMAWVRPLSTQQEYAGIIFNDNGSYGLNFSTGNQLGFHHESAGSDAWAWNSGLVVEQNVWSHVAMVANAEGVTLYLNGVPAERPLDLGPAEFGTMKIGSYKGWNGRNMNAMIDEVSIWDRALTVEEVRSHRHITKSVDNAEGLHAYYQFNGGTSRILDRVGLNHGSMRGLSILIRSTAPVGGGTAATVAGTTGDLVAYSFNEQDALVMAEIENGSMLTMTQINIPAQDNEVAYAFPEDSYWIANSYGAVAGSVMSFFDQEIGTSFETNPDGISLYERSANDSESPFEEKAVASFVMGTPSSISFDRAGSVDGQFVLSRNDVTTYVEPQSEALTVFPNPTSGALTIAGLDVAGELSVFDAKGNRVLFRTIKLADKIQLVETLPAGAYSYLIDAGKKLYTGRIVKVD